MDKSHDLNQRIKVLETQIKDMKTFQKQILQYRSNRAVFIQWQNMKNGKQRDAFYEARYSEIAQATAAADYFRAHEIKSPLPSPKKLQAEIDDLISRKAGLYAEYKDAKKIADELMTVKYNIDEASRMNPEHQQRNRQKRHGMTR
jgi:chaperonin cofactor prefoldin